MTKLLTNDKLAERCLRKIRGEKVEPVRVTKDDVFCYLCEETAAITPYTRLRSVRSEERRVGKEC